MTLLRTIDRVFQHDAAGGILMTVSADAALFVANIALAPLYDQTLTSVLSITLNGDELEKPLILWINDALMAMFFFLIGPELKRALLEGKLKKASDIALPGIAAVGGMALPALIFVALNWNSLETLGGWAIPAATDIARALGILALAGMWARAALKVFLLTLAILDELGAILVIALFYTAELKTQYLIWALLPLAGLSVADLFAPLPLGITAGLVLDKQIGMFGAVCLMVKTGWEQLPHGTTWAHFYGVSCLAGIGFTMSLFIGVAALRTPR